MPKSLPETARHQRFIQHCYGGMGGVRCTVSEKKQDNFFVGYCRPISWFVFSSKKRTKKHNLEHTPVIPRQISDLGWETALLCTASHRQDRYTENYLEIQRFFWTTELTPVFRYIAQFFRAEATRTYADCVRLHTRQCKTKTTRSAVARNKQHKKNAGRAAKTQVLATPALSHLIDIGVALLFWPTFARLFS